MNEMRVKTVIFFVGRPLPPRRDDCPESLEWRFAAAAPPLPPRIEGRWILHPDMEAAAQPPPDPELLPDDEYLRLWTDAMADLKITDDMTDEVMQMIYRMCITRNARLDPAQLVHSDPSDDDWSDVAPDVPAFLANETALFSATDLISLKWYAFDGGRQVAGPCDSMPDVYAQLRASGIQLSADACVAQRDNPRSTRVVLDGFTAAPL